MTEYWRKQRLDRITHRGRPGYSVEAVELGDEADFLHVRGQFLMTYQAAEVLDLTDPSNPDHALFSRHEVVEDFTAEGSALYDSGIRAWDYAGGADLPTLVAELQTRARTRVRTGTVPASASPGITEAECSVSLHYVVSGVKTWVPHGGPSGPPTSAPAPEARLWGSADPVIAVIDTGLAPGSATAQPDADGNRVQFLDEAVDVDALAAVLPDGSVTADLAAEAGHGTFITSVLGRMAGGHVAVVNVRALEPDGFGTEASVLDALRRLVGAHPGIPVVNMSFGGYTDPADHAAMGDPFADASPPDSPPLALGAWLVDHIESQRSTVFIAAAGNNGVEARPFWPAALAGVIAVASLDPHHEQSAFSNSGPWVDVCTVGEDIVGDYPSGHYPISENAYEDLSGGARWSGTSFAAPIFAAEVARQWVEAPSPEQPLKMGPSVAQRLLERLHQHGPPGCGVVWDPVRRVGIDPRAPLKEPQPGHPTPGRIAP